MKKQPSILSKLKGKLVEDYKGQKDKNNLLAKKTRKQPKAKKVLEKKKKCECSD